MENIRRRVPSEILKRGYSDEELGSLYELGKLYLESGDLRRAESIMHGINEIAPEFAAAWLAMSYIHFQNANNDGAVSAARMALKAEAGSVEALLALITGLLSLGDFNAAGTYLGEISEKIEGGALDDPKLVRFYKAQLARYQSR